jgi:hypothetical protein
MLIDFQRQLRDMNDEVMKLNGKDFLLVNACQEALLATFPDEQGLGGKEKVERFLLAMKITDGLLPVEISIEEAAQIKMLVGKAYGPLVVGRVWEVLDKAGNS